jgi:hypothetical protein
MDPAGFAIRGNIACVGVSSFPQTKGIYRSTDSGVTWSLISPMQGADIITMGTGGGTTMYAGDLFGAYVSHDDGFTWGGLGLGGAFTILAWDEYGFIGNNDGLFFSDDFGNSWTQMNEGMDPYPNNSVQGLARDNTYVYAGFYRNAIWRRPLSDFGTIETCGIVTNTSDSGDGSLRNTVACATNGSVITFDPTLFNQTISLSSGEIEVTKNLTINGLGMVNLTVSGHNNSRIFHILPGNTLTVKNLSLKDATAITNGGALFIEGNLIMENALLEHNSQNGIPKAWTASNSSHITVNGNVNVKN